LKVNIFSKKETIYLQTWKETIALKVNLFSKKETIFYESKKSTITCVNSFLKDELFPQAVAMRIAWNGQNDDLLVSLSKTLNDKNVSHFAFFTAHKNIANN
jgi:hypothetical protein